MVSDPRRKVRPINQMLEDPNKGVHKTHGSWGTLSKLWRVMLKDLHVSGYKFSTLMKHYVENPKNWSKKRGDDHADNRGNLNKEFSNPTMSWKVFCKCMKFLQVVEFRLTIEARHRDGHITTHRTMLNLEEDQLINDPRFVEEIEKSQNDPNSPNLPLPEDQEHISYLDPDDDAQ